MQAFNLFDAIQIKRVRSLLAGKVVDSSPQELKLQYGDNSYLFVYPFGSIVFFNMQQNLVDQEIKKLKEELGPGIDTPTHETYQVNVSDAVLKVEFEFVELKKLTIDHLRIIAMTVGQSAALEYFELKADGTLSQTMNLMQDLGRTGRVPLQPRRLLKIIGTTASTRQNILSNLAILDPPDEAWKSKELERLHFELQQNFDLEVRFRTIDRKLSLIQDHIGILANLTNTRRATMLEASIVILIVFEIVLALLTKH